MPVEPTGHYFWPSLYYDPEQPPDKKAVYPYYAIFFGGYSVTQVWIRGCGGSTYERKVLLACRRLWFVTKGEGKCETI